MDLFLKFPDEATANSLLYSGGEPNYLNTDVVGIISEGGEWGEEGNEIVPPTVLEGWHVNIRLVDGESEEPLLPYVVSPSSPVRVWA